MKYQFILYGCIASIIVGGAIYADNLRTPRPSGEDIPSGTTTPGVAAGSSTPLLEPGMTTPPSEAPSCATACLRSYESESGYASCLRECRGEVKSQPSKKMPVATPVF